MGGVCSQNAEIGIESGYTSRTARGICEQELGKVQASRREVRLSQERGPAQVATGKIDKKGMREHYKNELGLKTEWDAFFAASTLKKVCSRQRADFEEFRPIFCILQRFST